MNDSATWLRGMADDQEGAYGAAKLRKIADEMETDAKEIGSYRKRTGLRGDFRIQQDKIIEQMDQIDSLSSEVREAFTAGWVSSKSWGGVAPTKEGEATRIEHDYEVWRNSVSEGQK